MSEWEKRFDKELQRRKDNIQYLSMVDHIVARKGQSRDVVCTLRWHDMRYGEGLINSSRSMTTWTGKACNALIGFAVQGTLQVCICMLRPPAPDGCGHA